MCRAEPGRAAATGYLSIGVARCALGVLMRGDSAASSIA